MANPNRYPGSCNVCGDRVAARQGVLFRRAGKWTVAHTSCDDAEATEGGTLADNRYRSYKAIHGQCEDAPCCGCCGPGVDGYSRYSDGGDYL